MGEKMCVGKMMGTRLEALELWGEEIKGKSAAVIEFRAQSFLQKALPVFAACRVVQLTGESTREIEVQYNVYALLTGEVPNLNTRLLWRLE